MRAAWARRTVKRSLPLLGCAVAVIGLTAWGCSLDKKGGFGSITSGPGAGGGGNGGAGGGQPPYCGNGTLDPNEVCDDGNPEPGDGCGECQVECVLPEALEGEAFKHDLTHHCYLYVHDVVAIDDPARPWYDALYLCRAHGFELAAITTPDEFTFITGVTDPVPGPEIWIGGYDRDENDMFGWTTGETAEPAPWNVNEPNNSGENCIEILNEGLNNQECKEPRAYLCERHPPGSCGDGVIDPAEECDDGNGEVTDGCAGCKVTCDDNTVDAIGLKFTDPSSHHCYIYNDNSTDWMTAKATCEAIPGFYFAALSSAEERAFILSNPVVSGAWVGATDEVNEDEWVWSNGESWEFTPWEADPMNGGSENCLRFQFDDLIAEDCTTQHQVLCERDPVGRRSPEAP